MARFLLFGLLFFLGFSLTGQAQTSNAPKTTAPPQVRYLTLSKPGKIKRFHFHLGEDITYKLASEKRFQTGTILEIRDSAMVVDGYLVPLGQVTAVKLEKETGGQKVAGFGSNLLQLSGGLFTVIGAINYLSDTKNDPNDGKTTMVAGLSGWAVGKGLQQMQKGRYKLKNGWKLRVIDLF